MVKNRLVIFGIVIMVVLVLIFVYKYPESLPIWPVISPLSESDFAISGVKPYEQISNDIFKKLGDPITIKEVNGEEGRYKYYIYKDFVMNTSFTEDNTEMIQEFEVSGRDFKTKRGLKLGDSRAQLFAKYGSAKIEDGICFYDYKPSSPNTIGHTLQIKLVNDKITEIWIK